MPDDAPSAPAGKPLGAGTLPISVMNTNNKPAGTQKSTTARPPAVKLKVVIRRLPPGLTQPELDTALGDGWKVGAGKVTWSIYKPGKISRDVAKPSRPSRLYLHLSEQCHLEALAAHVQATSFIDARNTAQDPALIGPPALEFAMYQRIPTAKKRNDARQGLIDQDAEFIEFLESLTNPTVKPQNIDLSKEGKDEPVKVTPLIQHLRDKKAAKEKSKGDKASKSSRASKAAAAEAKTEAKSKDTTEKNDAKSSRRRKAEGSKKEITIQQPSKARPASPAVAKVEQAKPAAAEGRKRERLANGIGAAASLIQRDLGLRGGRAEGGRRGGGARGSVAKTATSENTLPTSATETTTAIKPGRAPKATATATSASTTPTPSVLKRQQPATTQEAPAEAPSHKPATSSSQTKPASVSPTATQAFLKHANPSQGITEVNLLTALSVFGSVSKVEIDKRKGFAYATFAEPKGLQAAAAAGLIPVAQGNVQVLERKERAKPNAAAASTGGSAPAVAASQSETPAAQTNTGGGRNAGGGRGSGRSGRGRGGNTRGGAASSTPTASSAAPAVGAVATTGNTKIATKNKSPTAPPPSNPT